MGHESTVAQAISSIVIFIWDNDKNDINRVGSRVKLVHNVASNHHFASQFCQSAEKMALS